jgi:hypothetical protein
MKTTGSAGQPRYEPVTFRYNILCLGLSNTTSRSIRKVEVRFHVFRAIIKVKKTWQTYFCKRERGGP